MSTLPPVIPPVGLPNGTGGFFNVVAFPVSNQNLLPPVQGINVPATTVVKSLFANRNAGKLALLANAAEAATAPSAGTYNNNPNVGSEGSLGLDGANTNSASVAGPNRVMSAVGPLASFQLNHPTVDFIGRVALPIAAILLFRRGRSGEALLLAAPSAALWANRLGWVRW
jgi:hypothetical protein